MSPETTTPTQETEQSVGTVSAEQQQEADELMSRLENLDTSDTSQVMDLLVDMQLASEDRNVPVNIEAVLNTFAAHGLDPADLSEVNSDDKEALGKNIVLNTLVSLQDNGYFPRALPHFADQWHSEFEAGNTEANKEN